MTRWPKSSLGSLAEIFRVQALLLEALLTKYEVPDDFVWALCRDMEELWERAVERTEGPAAHDAHRGIPGRTDPFLAKLGRN
jgi:hypothetical protein